MQRINQILNLIDEEFDLLIDIGSDHACLGIRALELKKTKHVWNVEIAQGPLSISKQNFSNSNYLDRASFYLSDGFLSIPEEIPDNTLSVIAGMGSKQIVNILEGKMPAKLKHLILLPHNHPFLIRQWANEKGWIITKEHYFKNTKHIYLVMVLKRSEVSFKPIDIYVGNPTFIEHHLPISQIYIQSMYDKIMSKDSGFWSEWERGFVSSVKKSELLKSIFNSAKSQAI